MMVANNEKEKDMWISKISQAIVDYSSIFVSPPPAPISSNASNGSRTTSRNSSNVSISEMSDGALGQEEDGEEGLLTFDDAVPIAGSA